MPPLTQESSHSSDYFDDDPEFLKALSEVQLPELQEEQIASSFAEPPLAQRPKLADDEPPRTQKRPRSPVSADDFEDDDGAHYHNVLHAVDANNEDESLNSYTYGASRFGEFGEYMVRKRAKLQIQNAEMEDEDEDGEPLRSRIFQSLQIYVRTLLLRLIRFS